MNTPSIGRRGDGYPDAEPYGPGPLPPPTAAERAEREAAYARMDGFFSSGSPNPHCEDVRHPHHDFDLCNRDVIANSALFARQSNDSGTIDPHDVQQGAMGDCHCMAVLCAMASSPEGRAALQNAITEDKNERGEVVSYTVTLHKPDRSWWP
jgi:hypothetical protein